MTLKSDAWMKRANCHGVDPKIFYPDEADFAKVARAKSYCNSGPCPVRQECLEYARRHKIVDGIWGGLTSKGRDLETAMNFEAGAFRASLLSNIPHEPLRPVRVALSFHVHTSSPSNHIPPVLPLPIASEPLRPDVVLLPSQTLSVAEEPPGHSYAYDYIHAPLSSSGLLHSPQLPKRPALQFRLTSETSSPLLPESESRPPQKVLEFHLQSQR